MIWDEAKKEGFGRTLERSVLRGLQGTLKGMEGKRPMSHANISLDSDSPTNTNISRDSYIQFCACCQLLEPAVNYFILAIAVDRA